MLILVTNFHEWSVHLRSWQLGKFCNQSTASTVEDKTASHDPRKRVESEVQMILEYHFKCSKTKLQLHRNSWSKANPETSTIPIPTSKVAIETLPTLPPEIGLRSGFQQGGDEGKTQAHCDEAADQPHHPIAARPTRSSWWPTSNNTWAIAMAAMENDRKNPLTSMIYLWKMGDVPWWCEKLPNGKGVSTVPLLGMEHEVHELVVLVWCFTLAQIKVHEQPKCLVL